MYKTISRLVGNTERTIFSWKQQNRPIIKLLEVSFTKNELENFLETGEKPYKIEFADKYFVGLYEEFARYIVFNKGAKALFAAIDKGASNKNIEKIILQEYKESNLDDFDVVSYFNNKPSKELLLYVFENKKTNWDIFKNSVNEGGHGWLVLYVEILLIATKKNMYDKVFGQPNKENKVEKCLVPPAPDFFGVYTNMNRILKKYEQILTSVKNAIVNEQYELLPKYDVFLSPFDMSTEPIKTELEKALDDELYMGEEELPSNLELEPEELQEVLDRGLGKKSKK